MSFKICQQVLIPLYRIHKGLNNKRNDGPRKRLLQICLLGKANSSGLVNMIWNYNTAIHHVDNYQPLIKYVFFCLM